MGRVSAADLTVRKPRAVRWLLALLLAGAFCLAALAGLYVHLGYTPGQLMDYAERQLEGQHPLEAIALPILSAARAQLDEPSMRERRSVPFVIPDPPLPIGFQQGAAAAAADGAPTGGRVWRVGPAEAIRSIAEVARRARDGDTVEIVAADYHGEVAVWLQRRLVIRAVGGRARLFADGQSAEGKAIWVIRDGDFVVSNIDFIGVRVADRNGAGIRFENGHLIVRNCLFWGSDSGLLTASGLDRRQARLEIEGSEFAYNGDGGGQSHHVYVGDIASFRVTGSYFHHGNVGHLIKSRAAINEIRYNRITDERGGRASYEVDLPNGGIAVLVGNIIQQSRETENSTLIAFGEEGYTWPENRIYLMSNTLVNDQPYGGAFLRVAPGADSTVSANNVLSGRGGYHASEVNHALNDVTGNASLFFDAANGDYRLSAAGRNTPFQKPVTSTYRSFPLDPQAEYVHPRSVRILTAAPLYPGALQSVPP